MAEYNTMELMIVAAARNLEDGATVGVGTGAPCAAAMLANTVDAAVSINGTAATLAAGKCSDFPKDLLAGEQETRQVIANFRQQHRGGDRVDLLHQGAFGIEILVRLEGDTIHLRPIAGTRPRGETPEEDRRLEGELLSDPPGYPYFIERVGACPVVPDDIPEVSFDGSLVLTMKDLLHHSGQPAPFLCH
jgi:hypothetical protein